MKLINKKYIITSGYIKSQTDGQMHNITSEQLIRLHGVKREDCYIATLRGHKEVLRDNPDLIHLYPRYDGKYRNYSITLKAVEEFPV